MHEDFVDSWTRQLSQDLPHWKEGAGGSLLYQPAE